MESRKASASSRRRLARHNSRFRVSGWGAQPAEVAGGPDDALTEVVLPDAIDHDPRRQGMPGYGLGQLQATASLVKRLGLAVAQHRQESARGGIAQVVGIAPDVDAGITGTGRVGHPVDIGVGRRAAALQLLQLGA